MNMNIITKILDKRIPKNIIREILSYFTLKDTVLFERMEYLISNRYLYLRSEFYPDGEFRYNLFQPQGSINRYFLLIHFPELFLEYHFCIDNRISSIRFWIKDNKCEVPVDGYWVEK